MMRKIAFLSLFAVTACGTLFSGVTQNVTFNSNVKGTAVYLDGIEICKTPCSTDLDRSADAVTGGVWEYKNNLVYLQMERKGLSSAEQKRFVDESKAKHFALFNYDLLLGEAVSARNGEYTQVLQSLSGFSEKELHKLLNESPDEVAFVNQLTLSAF